MPASNVAPQTAPRPVIIPATPIRPVETPTHRNEEEIANRMMTAPRAPASYAQVTAKNSSDLDKSQWVTVQKKGKTTEKKEIKRAEISNRFIFTRQGDIDRMPEEDLMLELNIEIRRLESVPKSVKTIKILYLGKGAISVLLSDKSDANELVNKYRDRLIKIVKIIDVLIIGAEVVIK